jgi:hypothetical protein
MQPNLIDPDHRRWRDRRVSQSSERMGDSTMARVLAVFVLIVVTSAARVDAATAQQHGLENVSIFVVRSSITDAGGGWRWLDLTLGFRNNSDDGVYLKYAGADRAYINVAEGRSYDAKLRDQQGNLGVPAHGVFCGVTSPYGSTLFPWTSPTVYARIPEAGTPLSLSIAGYADVDLTQAPDPEMCRPDVEALPPLPDSLEIGEEGGTPHYRLGLAFDQQTQGLRLTVDNLDVLDDLTTGLAVTAFYENGVWDDPFGELVDSDSAVPCLAADASTDDGPTLPREHIGIDAGPGESNAFDFCLPQTDHHVLAFHVGVGTLSFTFDQTFQSGEPSDAVGHDLGELGATARLAEFDDSGITGVVSVLGLPGGSARMTIDSLTQFDEEPFSISVIAGDCSDPDNSINWQDPDKLRVEWTFGEVQRAPGDSLAGLGYENKGDIRTFLSSPHAVTVVEFASHNGDGWLIACGELKENI